jgi:predicted nucleic acid-binding protein
MTDAVERVIVVCDAGPIIHLDELECLELLKDFHEILLPDTVYKEIIRHRPEALDYPQIPFIHCSPDYLPGERLATMFRMFSLDAGEMEALAIMENKTDAMFLTDDAAARLVAEQMRFKVHGTIGIIIRAVRRRMRTPEQLLSILRRIPQKSSLHLKSSLLDQIIGSVKKEFHL